VLVPAVAFSDLVLGRHILAVVIAFGVTFAYPLFAIVGARMDPSAMPWFHRMQQVVGRRLVNPALLIVLLAGIYLASHLHQWSAFYVQWGLAAVVVLGGLEGGFMIPREGRLADLAGRDLAAAAVPLSSSAPGSGSAAAGASSATVSLSPEYQALLTWVGIVGALMQLTVVITVFMMAARAGT
jgi:hypothetical protein